MAERFPGYNVLSKRNSPSWNEQTRQVVDERLRLDPDTHAFCTDGEWRTLRAVCDCIIPQPPGRPLIVPLAAMVDQKLHAGRGDGYRDGRLPDMCAAWRRGLAAIEAEAELRHGKVFADLDVSDQDALLAGIQTGEVKSPAWDGLPREVFFTKRLLHDIVSAYYAHPASWNEIGFGGPAAPRGYVRMDFDRRDPWEAAEAYPGEEDRARKDNARVG